MYDHIIVPFDGTKEAMTASLVGADLGKLFDARLVVVTGADLGSSKELQLLKGRAIQMSEEGVDVWVEGETKPARAVASAIDHRPNTLVCMATHGRTGVGRAIFGNVAEQILRTIDTPALLLGPELQPRDPVDMHQLILCLDGTPTSESAVTLAGAWANALDLRCLLLHVTGDGPKEAPSTVELDRYVRTLEAVCPSVDTLEIEDNDAVDGIIEVCRHGLGSMLVMATHGRSGIDRFTHGSVMAEVTRRSPIPILVQRGGSELGVDYLQSSAGTE